MAVHRAETRGQHVIEKDERRRKCLAVHSLNNATRNAVMHNYKSWEIKNNTVGWLDDLTDGGVEYMPEDEVKVAAAERLRISMERIALLKAAQPKKKIPKSDDDEDEEEEDDESNEEDEDKIKKKKEKKKMARKMENQRDLQPCPS
ncbi:protein TPLATE-like [Pyrus communis]|uniref:protein TPLATE-like n=1 Tax=Pyrus communis TaxID=23211 RepID=UPI0035BED320